MTKKKDYLEEFNEIAGDDPEAESGKSSSEDFARMLNESLSRKPKKHSVGDKVEAKILVLGKEDVFVIFGGREGVAPKRDFLDEKNECSFKVGDVVSLYVTQVRGEEVRLSRNPTDRNLAEDLEDAFDMELPIAGRVVEVCKGGVRVNLKGKLAFCPISQLDVERVETGEEYVGKSFDFRITQFSEGGRNIVVSRRKLLEAERELGALSFLEENKDGSIVTGKIVRLEKFGAFVELAPAVDGLVHISEIAWSRINDPAEVLQVNQPVTVKILKRETVNGRLKISLSIKQAIPKEEQQAARTAAFAASDPAAKLSVGQVLEGKITRKEPYGLFVQLAPGATGLLHRSRTEDAPDFKLENYKVGDSLSVKIGEIKPETKQISLALPGDPDADDWRQHSSAAGGVGSFGTLGDRLKSALAKKK